jgi:hypothetical protein
MSDEPAYVSRIEIEKVKGPIRRAYMPVEKEPVLFGAHGAIAEHYGVDPSKIEPHAATLDYLVAATGG